MQYLLQGVTGDGGLYQSAININTGTRLNTVLEFILGCLIFYIFPGAKGFTPSRINVLVRFMRFI